MTTQYPKIPRGLQKRCKLVDSEIAKIKLLRQQGKSIHALSRNFLVSRMTIRYWTEPEYQKRDKEKAIKRTQKLRADPEKKRILNAQRAREIREARQNIPQLKNYHKAEYYNRKLK